MNLNELKNELLQNPKNKKQFEKFDLAFELGEVLTDLRVENGYTQADIAKKLGTKQSGIARLESGKRFPSLAVLNKLGNIYNIGLSRLFGLAEKNIDKCTTNVDSATYSTGPLVFRLQNNPLQYTTNNNLSQVPIISFHINQK